MTDNQKNIAQKLVSGFGCDDLKALAKAADAAEIKTLAAGMGKKLTGEEAEALFAKLSADAGMLDEDELGSVAGGIVNPFQAPYWKKDPEAR